jgi:hypothetical protein
MIRKNAGLVALAFAAFTACHEPERPEPKWEISSQRLEVQGKNELLFTLPDNFQREVPVISAAASGASLTELFRNDAGQWTLRYISSEGKPGIDHLSIDSEDEAAERAEHHGSCQPKPHPKLFGPKHPKKAHHPGHYRLNLEVSVLEANTSEQKLLPSQNGL